MAVKGGEGGCSHAPRGQTLKEWAEQIFKGTVGMKEDVICILKGHSTSQSTGLAQTSRL